MLYYVEKQRLDSLPVLTQALWETFLMRLGIQESCWRKRLWAKRKRKPQQRRFQDASLTSVTKKVKEADLHRRHPGCQDRQASFIQTNREPIQSQGMTGKIPCFTGTGWIRVLSTLLVLVGRVQGKHSLGTDTLRDEAGGSICYGSQVCSLSKSSVALS